MSLKLYYEEKGIGFPLILLHGNGENLEYFEHQIACKAEAFNTRVKAFLSGEKS